MKVCLKFNDIDINKHALWIMAFLTDTGDSNLRKLLDLCERKTIKIIIDWTLSPEAELKRPAIRIICNILTGDNQCIQVFLHF